MFGRYVHIGVASAFLVAACSGEGAHGSAVDAGAGDEPTGTLNRHPPLSDARPDTTTKTPWDRMQAHQHIVLPSMHIYIVYIGDAGVDGSPAFDAFVSWLLASDYWKLMNQYGVGAGAVDGFVRVSPATFFPAGLVSGGLITAQDLDSRVYDILRASADGGTSPPDAGSDAGAEAGADAGASLIVPQADAYLFFLPDGVNVSLGSRGGHTFQTCVEAGGYHTFDTIEPYAVIPPCSFGRSELTISHELAEMATDPSGGGWFSDKDIDNAGGEIGDLCNHPVPHDVEGWTVTQLWSNADGDCEPH